MARNVDDFITDTEHSAINHAGLPGINVGDAFPIGAIVPFGAAVSSIPPGWLACDGSAYGRTSGDPSPQPDLFGVIGTTWGIGDGATTFNVPDMRAKSALGLNDGTLPAGADGGFTTRTLAATGGAETHALTSAENGAHTHTVTDPTHTHAVTDPGHTHTIPTTSLAVGATDEFLAGAQLNQADRATLSSTTNLTVNAASTGLTVDSAGSGTAHNTMHPFAVCNYIIKALNVGGGAQGLSVQVSGGALEGPQPILNLIPGTGIDTITPVEDVGNTRVDVTVSAAVKLVQQVRDTFTGTNDPGSAIPFDGTIPQNTEGAEIMTAVLTPTSSSNVLLIEATVFVGHSAGTGSNRIVALFKDADASATAAAVTYDASGDVVAVNLRAEITTPTTSSQTWRIRVGNDTNNARVNGNAGSTTPLGAGMIVSSLVVSEIAP